MTWLEVVGVVVVFGSGIFMVVFAIAGIMRG